MTLRSMTGYGTAKVAGKGFQIVAEVSSVNRKQVDIRTKFSQQLLCIEPSVMEEIHKVITSGRVTCNMFLRDHAGDKPRDIHIDEKLARNYLSRIRKISNRLKVSKEVSIEYILGLPGVVNYSEPSVERDILWPVCQRALRKALRELDQMRLAEGKVLGDDLAVRINGMQNLVKKISNKAPLVVKHHRKMMKKRLDEAGIAIDSSDARLLREIAIFADRCDITEELTRLDSHFKQVRRLLNARKPVGRSLDFMAQEMLREYNTIGSKAHDAAIRTNVVACKAELERFREQVQNIE